LGGFVLWCSCLPEYVLIDREVLDVILREIGELKKLAMQSVVGLKGVDGVVEDAGVVEEVAVVGSGL